MIPAGTAVYEVLAIVARQYGIPIDELPKKGRTQTVARARQDACALLRDTTKMSLPEIGRVFDRDHTTIIHGLRSTVNRLKNDPEAAKLFAKMRVEVVDTRKKATR